MDSSLIGIFATPIFIGVALISTGAGHESYLSALVFYPIPLFLLFLQPVNIDDSLLKGMASARLAMLQFPAHGLLISYSRTKKDSKFWTARSTAKAPMRFPPNVIM